MEKMEDIISQVMFAVGKEKGSPVVITYGTDIFALFKEGAGGCIGCDFWKIKDLTKDFDGKRLVVLDAQTQGYPASKLEELPGGIFKCAPVQGSIPAIIQGLRDRGLKEVIYLQSPIQGGK